MLVAILTVLLIVPIFCVWVLFLLFFINFSLGVILGSLGRRALRSGDRCVVCLWSGYKDE